MRHRLRREAQDGRMDVDAVRDQLGRRARGGERRADHARLAVMQAAHGVEKMREVRRAPLQRRDRLGVVGRGVADGERDRAPEVLDQAAHSFDLRRDRDDPSHPRRVREQRADFVDVGPADRRRVLRAGAFAVDVRPFEMDGADLRPLGLTLGRTRAIDCDGRLQVAARGGERRRRERRRPVPRVEAEDAFVRALVGIHEIGAVAAVHVQVDESRHDDSRDALRLRRGTAPLARPPATPSRIVTSTSGSIAPSRNARPWSLTIGS